MSRSYAKYPRFSNQIPHLTIGEKGVCNKLEHLQPEKQNTWKVERKIQVLLWEQIDLNIIVYLNIIIYLFIYLQLGPE